MGRISHGCLGLYSDANEAALARVLDPARRVAAPGTRFAIQLGHAGRKASCQRPCEGGKPLPPRRGRLADRRAVGRPVQSGRTAAAGARRQGPASASPRRSARRRSAPCGSASTPSSCMPRTAICCTSSSRRCPTCATTATAAAPENRMRFPLEVARAVRAVVPRGVALGARITGTRLGRRRARRSTMRWPSRPPSRRRASTTSASRAAARCPACKIPLGPGYQVPLAAKVKAATGIVTRAVGLIAAPEQAEAIVAEGPGRLRRPGARLPRRPALGVARGRAAGRRDLLRRPTRASSAPPGPARPWCGPEWLEASCGHATTPAHGC